MTLSPDELPRVPLLGGRFNSYPGGWIEWDKNPAKSYATIGKDIGSQALTEGVIIDFPTRHAPESVPEITPDVPAATRLII